MKLLTAFASFFLGAMACTVNAQSATEDIDDFVAQAKANVVKILKDPQAAQFRELYVSNESGMLILCGEINAKNSYGAYTGFKPFYASKNPLIQEIASDRSSTFLYEQLAPKVCGRRVADVKS